MTYRANLVKPASAMRKYSFLREVGVTIPTRDGTHRLLKGAELDEFVNTKIWEAAHPGLSPTKEYSSGVPEE